MKNVFLLLILLICITLPINFSFADDRTKRFSKPHEEEAEEKSITNNSFKDYQPSYNSSVFINYNISRDSFPQNETAVRISRKDPNRVVAAWRDFRTGVNPANRKVGYSLSTNGGQTWSISKLLDSTLLTGYPRNSDPVVTIDSAGNFYIAVVTLGINGALAIYKSTDGGETFPFATLVANSGSEDKEYMETDLVSGSPYYNYIYISWTRFSGPTGIKGTKSTNEGINWSSPVNISDVTNGVQGSDLAIGLNGEVYVTWLDGNTSDDKIQFDKSTNGGTNFGTDKTIAQGTSPIIPISQSGITFPSIASDISGNLYNGNIYVTWCDARNGDPDIFISRSTNRGDNWSTPLRVNNDAVGNGKLQCWPWIAVSDSGYIAILYYDSRNTSSNNIIEAYLAYSRDGGQTFTNYLLSTQPSPTNQPNQAIRFGDYIGIDFWKNKIVPVWTDERAGGFNMEAYTAIVSSPVSVSSLSNQIPDKFELKQNYPNPFNPNTVISYKLQVTSYISLKVYNGLGNEVASLVNERQNAGSYSVKFDGRNLSSGIYYYKIIADGFVDTKKMILLK